MIEYAAMMKVATSLREREVSSSDWNSRVAKNLASYRAGLAHHIPATRCRPWRICP